jgi:hypothetical protein
MVGARRRRCGIKAATGLPRAVSLVLLPWLLTLHGIKSEMVVGMEGAICLVENLLEGVAAAESWESCLVAREDPWGTLAAVLGSPDGGTPAVPRSLILTRIMFLHKSALPRTKNWWY